MWNLQDEGITAARLLSPRTTKQMSCNSNLERTHSFNMVLFKLCMLRYRSNQIFITCEFLINK
ncbi:unnamed protein product [Leptidea sinapis]|uniref:Uncharacterized protein n=1 Tax=Leptidea sinapis TaxID=189913 RepID=A0A5E4QWT9_9NEOP|nr:unnamed protein product [Leptidea sinapis]